MKFILTLPLLLAFATSLRGEVCASYEQQRVCITSDAKEDLFQAVEEKFYKPFFVNAYRNANAEGRTTLTLQEFRQYYLPYLQRTFLTNQDAISSSTKHEAAGRIRDAIIALPKETDKWYGLYARTYGYEHFLYQWTIGEIESYGIEPPKDILASRMAPAMADFHTLIQNGMSENKSRQLGTEKEEYIFRQQELYTIRQYLVNCKISHSLAFENPLMKTQFSEWNRKKFLSAILPAHREFAQYLVMKIESRY